MNYRNFFVQIVCYLARFKMVDKNPSRKTLGKIDKNSQFWKLQMTSANAIRRMGFVLLQNMRFYLIISLKFDDCVN